MKAFRLRLEQAVGSGATLALLTLPACASTSTGGSNGGSGASGASGMAGAATAGEGGASTAGAAGEGNQLSPYPVGALGCSGPEHDGGYYGQCCAEALCYTPDDGSECVASEAAPNKLGTFYGSGSCLCGAEPIRGPFAANPAHDPAQAGTCCYVISSITCEGRPLLVDGAPLLSALTRRRDWLAVDMLEISA